MDAVDKWRSRWDNALLDLFIHTAISLKPRYGAELIEMAKEQISKDIKIPTVYAITKRSKKFGLLDDTLLDETMDISKGITRGISRRYYTLTEKGREYLDSISDIMSNNLKMLSIIRSDKFKEILV